jgi:hypothetical protein
MIMKMKRTSSFLLSIMLSMSLAMPLRVRAEEEAVIPASGPAAAQADAEEASTESAGEDPVAPAEAEVQETIDSSLLEEAANPQEGALEEAIEVIDEATEERLESEILIEATSTEQSIEIDSEEEEVIESVEAEEEEVAELEMSVLIPTKEYTFNIIGSPIATKETPEWSEGEELGVPEEGEVTVQPAISVDTNLLNISGSCSDPYYVILIYRNAGDYDIDPGSYIFNRAFLCENGNYSYELSDLPFNLESGTFYLLVGGQGARGSWKPISALTPIGITVRTIMTEASSTPNEQ